MSAALIVHRITPGATLQDMGRTGYLAFGLSRGGAMDRVALAEGAALLRQDAGLAALELPGTGGSFEATEAVRIALTGAPMKAHLDGEPLIWNASHQVPKGARIEIGAVTNGSIGYLHVGGGFDVPPLLQARSAHLAAKVGTSISAGDRLPIGLDPRTETGMCLPLDTRFGGGRLRLVESFQTQLYDTETRDRFQATRFHRDARANRMGMRLNSDGGGFFAQDGLNILSETVVPGDIQVTGDGTPFLLMAESQTTGGYPRIGTVIPADLAKAAQTPSGGDLSFQFIPLEDALKAEDKHRAYLKALPKLCTALVRDPAQMRDLLSYQLISGATAGWPD